LGMTELVHHCSAKGGRCCSENGNYNVLIETPSSTADCSYCWA
jgi:hypothetical protein